MRRAFSKDVLAAGLGMCLPLAVLVAFMREVPPVGLADARRSAPVATAHLPVQPGIAPATEPAARIASTRTAVTARASVSGTAVVSVTEIVSPTAIVTATATATVVATVTVTAAAPAVSARAPATGSAGGPGSGGAVAEAATISGVDFPDGWILPPPPYFALSRPFPEAQDARPTRFYPYGTDAGGEYLLHHGVDIGGAMGDPIVAVAGGRVVYAGDDLDRRAGWGPMPDFYGQLVVIEHLERLGTSALYSVYGHVETVEVRAGQTVVAGQRIATVGGRGIALGPHLHLEFRTEPRAYDATLNPELFFKPLAGHGAIVVRVREADGGRARGVPIALYAVEADGSERWISEVPSYPAEPVNSAWRWGEDAVFGDVPLGSYVVRTRGAFQSSAPADVRSRGAVVVTLSPAPSVRSEEVPSPTPP